MPHDYIDQHSKTTEKDWQLREQPPVFLACSPKPTNQMTQSEKRRSEVTQSSGTRFPNTKRKLLTRDTPQIAEWFTLGFTLNVFEFYWN